MNDKSSHASKDCFHFADVENENVVASEQCKNVTDTKQHYRQEDLTNSHSKLI